jgi:hypothetical protein
VFVGKGYLDWILVCAGIVVFFAGLLILVFLQPPIAWTSINQTVPVVIVGTTIMLLRMLMIWRTRHWFSADDDGFVLTTYRGKRFISDDEITDIAMTEHQLAGITKRSVRIAFRTNGRADSFAFEQFVLVEKIDDSLGNSLQRALENLVVRAREEIDQGETLSGTAWTLTREQMTIKTGVVSRIIPLVEIVSVDWIDNAVCVWAEGEAVPVLKASGNQRGSKVLFRVLGDMIALRKTAEPLAVKDPGYEVVETPEHAEPKDAAGAVSPEWNPTSEVPFPALGTPKPTELPGGASEAALGRLLFSRQAVTERQVANAELFAIVGAVVGLGLLVYGVFDKWQSERGRAAVIFGPLLVVITVLIWWSVWRRSGWVFHCYTNGVCKSTDHGTATLMYSDVGAFTFSGVRHFINGGYAGTSVKLLFEPLAGVGGEPISYEGEFRFNDVELDKLRDFISKKIAIHMLGRLRQGQPVKWTGQLAFTAEGLAIVREGGSGKGRVVPYNEVAHHEFKDGVFFLHSKTDFGRPIKELVSQQNFFPGFYLLLLLTTPTGKDAPR